MALLLFEGSQRVASIYHGVLPRSQRIALFHRAGYCILMKETWFGFVCLSPRGYNGLHRSITYGSVSFPLLRRPSLVIMPLWVACWERAFNKLFVMVHWLMTCVTVDNVLPRSIIFLSFRTPGILISIASLPLAFWSWGWYFRRHPCNKAHHWSRFCCDSFFS